MSTDDEILRAAGCVIVGGFEGTELPNDAHALLQAGRIAGVILFKRNITSLEQTYALNRQIADATPAGTPPPIIAVDQEGGRVARLSAPFLTLPPMRTLGDLDDVELTRTAAGLLGQSLRALGFSTDFAPVADVDSNPANPVIGDRSFSRDPHRVARHVVAFIDGLQRSGIAACAKHFPGHGDTDLDSHLALPRIVHARDRIDSVELVPFRAAFGAGVASIMTAHVVFDAIAPNAIATISRAVVSNLLRDELGFDGVCFSDDLGMQAIAASHSVETSAVESVRAGCDSVLICTDPSLQKRSFDALVARAREDLSFRARLFDAARRVSLLRERFAPNAAPSLPEALAIVQSDASREIAARLRAAGRITTR